MVKIGLVMLLEGPGPVVAPVAFPDGAAPFELPLGPSIPERQVEMISGMANRAKRGKIEKMYYNV